MYLDKSFQLKVTLSKLFFSKILLAVLFLHYLSAALITFSSGKSVNPDSTAFETPA